MEKIFNCYVGLFVKGWLEKIMLLLSNGIDYNIGIVFGYYI